MATLNADLRKTVAEMVHRAGEGHIPSSYSIVDILEHLYSHVLKYDPKNPKWEERDYFILSKGHAAAGFFSVLHKHGFLTDQDLSDYSTKRGILGGHPDCTKVPGAEASTGSLGHGFPFAMGIALGLRIQNRPNRVITLVGDGECNEGTIWETALVASNMQLGNFAVIVDFNESSDQVLPVRDLKKKWEAFNWKAHEIDGHSESELKGVFEEIHWSKQGQPTAIVARTVKGKGVSFVEGHGLWHHKVPNSDDMKKIIGELS